MEIGIVVAVAVGWAAIAVLVGVLVGRVIAASVRDISNEAEHHVIRARTVHR